MGRPLLLTKAMLENYFPILMFLFVGLVVGFIYEWMKGALEWE